MLRKSIMMALLLLTIACGEYGNHEVIKYEKENNSMSGIHYFKNGGSIEVWQRDKNIYIIDSYLATLNPKNNTFGEFPRLSLGKVPLDNLKTKKNGDRFFVVSKNLNFRNGNDVEEDSNGSNIRGLKRVDVKLTFKANEKVIVEIKVYSNKINNNINEVVVDRKLMSL